MFNCNFKFILWIKMWFFLKSGRDLIKYNIKKRLFFIKILKVRKVSIKKFMILFFLNFYFICII